MSCRGILARMKGMKGDATGCVHGVSRGWIRLSIVIHPGTERQGSFYSPVTYMRKLLMASTFLGCGASLSFAQGSAGQTPAADLATEWPRGTTYEPE